MASIGAAISTNACARARPPRLCEGAMCFAAKSPRFSRPPRAFRLVTATEKERVGRSGCGRGRCGRMRLLRLLTARCTQIPANTDDHYPRRSLRSPTPNAADAASSSVSHHRSLRHTHRNPTLRLRARVRPRWSTELLLFSLRALALDVESKHQPCWLSESVKHGSSPLPAH